MRIAQAMFDPIPLDDDPVLDETLRPFLEASSGLVRALKAGMVSVEDHVRITSALEKVSAGAFTISPFGDVADDGPHSILRLMAEKYADTRAEDAEPEPLQKKRGKIDPANVVVGMKVRGHDGTIGTITKVRGASVNIDFPNGEGVCLIDHVEAA